MGGIRDISEQQWGACPWDIQDAQVDESYAYDSAWKLIAHPEDTLPDLVVTTQGTRQKGEHNKVESINDIRTFSFHSGKYTRTSRQDVTAQSQE